VNSDVSELSDASKQSEPAAEVPAEAESRAQLVARLFREHNESLVGFLAARLRSRQEALEVAQEAYVRMLNLNESNAVSFLRAFLFKTAANIAVDRMRSRERRQQLREAALFEEFREPPGPERSLVGEQEVAVVERVIAKLPPKCRRAFLLNRIHGLEPAEIARQMEVAERTVRHYILQALLQCRAALDAAQSVSSPLKSMAPKRGEPPRSNHG
jgi:RNA polymerase sigma factor (sigma-70 family)